jgi:hypothetical protein
MLAYSMYLLNNATNSMYRIAVGSIGLTCAIGAIAEKVDCHHEVNRRISALAQLAEENENENGNDSYADE